MAETLGLQLVRMLTEQLQGTIEMVNGHGSTFRLRFGRTTKNQKAQAIELTGPRM